MTLERGCSDLHFMHLSELRCDEQLIQTAKLHPFPTRVDVFPELPALICESQL